MGGRVSLVPDQSTPIRVGNMTCIRDPRLYVVLNENVHMTTLVTG